MTSSKLADILSGNIWADGAQYLFSPEEIYQAGSLAQKDICNELRLLETTANLITVAGQEQYSYPPVTITGVTNTNPAVITAISHPFKTGDTVVIGGVLGATGVNGKRTITRLTADSFSVAVAAGGAYTSGGIAYHSLWSAIQVRSARHVSPYIVPIDVISSDQAELLRNQFTDNPTSTNQSVDSTGVTKLYMIYDDPMVIGFLGTPNDVYTVELRFYRRPYPHEDLSLSVNPIIDSRFDALLISGARYYAHLLRSEDALLKRAMVLEAGWRNSLAIAQKIKARDRAVLDINYPALKW